MAFVVFIGVTDPQGGILGWTKADRVIAVTYGRSSLELPSSPASFCGDPATASLFITQEPLKIAPLSTIRYSVVMLPVLGGGLFQHDLPACGHISLNLSMGNQSLGDDRGVDLRGGTDHEEPFRDNLSFKRSPLS